MSINIERDKWLYVWAGDETAARKFFGAPEGTEVKLHQQDGDRRYWAVKADFAETGKDN